MGNVTLWMENRARFVDPYVSPLLANGLTNGLKNGLKNLPETFLLNVNFASTRDEGHWLNEKLGREGVKVVYRFVENGFDGMLSERYLSWGVESSLEEFEELVKFIKNL
jgi:acetyl esterase/lipase